MKLKNNSTRVICIDEKAIIPEHIATVDDSNKKNAVVAAMLKNGDLEEVQEETKSERATLGDFEALLAKEPNYNQLKAFARKNNIEIGDAKGVEELTAVIKAVLSM